MRKNIIKKAVVTTSLAMAMAFGFNAVAASAATVKFFIQNDGAKVNDTTTEKDTVSQPTDQFSSVVFETELNRTKADGNVNEFNGEKYVNNGDVERTLGEDIMAALSEKVERGTVDWYVLKEESDGWHVDGIKLETPNKTGNNGHKGDNGPAHDANGKADNVQPASTPAAIVVPATPSTPAAIVVPATPITPAAIETQNPSTETEDGTETESKTEDEDVAKDNDTQNDQGDLNNNNENNGNNSENNTPAYIVPIIYDYVPVVVEPEAEEVIELEEVETPEAAVEEVEEVAEEVVEEAEEIEIEELETPEGAVEEVEEVTEEVEEEEVVEEVETVEEVEEEEIEIEDLETPEGDVLPQTGLASAMVLYGLGALCVAAGATVAFKAGRKEEE